MQNSSNQVKSRLKATLSISCRYRDIAQQGQQEQTKMTKITRATALSTIFEGSQESQSIAGGGRSVSAVSLADDESGGGRARTRGAIINSPSSNNRGAGDVAALDSFHDEEQGSSPPPSNHGDGEDDAIMAQQGGRRLKRNNNSNNNNKPRALKQRALFVLGVILLGAVAGYASTRFFSHNKDGGTKDESKVGLNDDHNGDDNDADATKTTTAPTLAPTSKAPTVADAGNPIITTTATPTLAPTRNTASSEDNPWLTPTTGSALNNTGTTTNGTGSPTAAPILPPSPSCPVEPARIIPTSPSSTTTLYKVSVSKQVSNSQCDYDAPISLYLQCENITIVQMEVPSATVCSSTNNVVFDDSTLQQEQYLCTTSWSRISHMNLIVACGGGGGNDDDNNNNNSSSLMAPLNVTVPPITASCEQVQIFDMNVESKVGAQIICDADNVNWDSNGDDDESWETPVMCYTDATSGASSSTNGTAASDFCTSASHSCDITGGMSFNQGEITGSCTMTAPRIELWIDTNSNSNNSTAANGCPRTATRGEGHECSADAECTSGVCQKSICWSGPRCDGQYCETNAHCQSGHCNSTAFECLAAIITPDGDTGDDRNNGQNNETTFPGLLGQGTTGTAFP